MRVLVTGASGFVGTALLGRLSATGRCAMRACARRALRALPAGVEPVLVGDLGPHTDWRAALAGVDTVVHLSGRVHIMRDATADPLAEYRRANVAGTVSLARQMASAGGRRLVFLSSVKVNGEVGICREADRPAPHGAYAVSKHEAELGLGEVAGETGLDVVIIRSPLVYGPGVKANFRALMHALARGIPLPLGAVDNRRSLVALANLVDFIVTCIEHPAAANETFLVSDGEDLSTPDLIRRLARAMGRPARLVPVPESLLWAGATLLGKRDVAKRLLGSLQVDISKARQTLGWTPPVTVEDGLRQAVAAP